MPRCKRSLTYFFYLSLTKTSASAIAGLGLTLCVRAANPSLVMQTMQLGKMTKFGSA